MSTTAQLSPAIASSLNVPAVGRIRSIDALRGLVILLMLVDHAREFFFIHAQVSDPMSLEATSPALFFTRFSAHFCAPVFVALAGLGAWLYGDKACRSGADGTRSAAGFLVKRGLFLVALELTVVSFAWTFSLTPELIYLQVIWVIGLSMIALAGLVYLPRPVLIVVGLAIVLGHNLLDPITVAEGRPGHTIWTILHDRGFIDLPWGAQARTSYPLLPWIGVVALGYGIGPWFAGAEGPRRRRLLLTGLGALALFAVLRAINVYGDAPWSVQRTLLQTMMSVLNLTKYPPSADFLLLTLGAGALVLAALEKMPQRLVGMLAVFGGAPLFFYLIHLYGLHLLNLAAFAIFGPSQGEAFGVPGVGWLWLIAALVAWPCWYACRWFAGVKRGSRHWWMRYL